MNIETWWPSGRGPNKQTRERFASFAQKMANRLVQGFFRYGDPRPEKKYLTRMEMELRAYRRSGNAEHLYNVANYAVLETVAPEHRDHHEDTTLDSVTRGKV